jgi:hypothetical protein
MNLGTEISTVVIKDPPVPGKKVVFLSNYPLVFALSPSSTAGSHRSLCDTDVPGVQWDRAFASKVIVTAPPPKQNAEKGPSGAGFTSSRNVCSYRCAREKIPIPPPAFSSSTDLSNLTRKARATWGVRRVIRMPRLNATRLPSVVGCRNRTRIFLEGRAPESLREC